MDNSKETYIVHDILGFYVVEGDTSTDAWAAHMTKTTGLEGVIAFDKKELYEWLKSRGYSTLAKTLTENVYFVS